ncbi:MAG: menaquinone biosynthesis protein [Bacteroidales bacterium]|nr:menaquinone biosynthesis protein [Bacteroidales bacterium]MDD3273726.1 menaquinone biosynthesis protein [Bacteroidales bacterium]
MKVRVSAISYLNTAPFVYGLENHPVSRMIELEFVPPSVTATKVISGEADLGLVPVAAIPYISNPFIVSDYCIGAEGSVASVLLCSGRRIEEIEKINLDTESRTSVLLTRILCKNFWKIAPDFVDFNFLESHLDENESYILIGDKALLNASRFKYVYDLAEVWMAYKQLPFVFACWTANKELPESFLKSFNEALTMGINNVEKSVERFAGQFERDYALNYLKNNISYNFTADKRKGLSEFWSLAPDELKSRVRWFG